MMTVINCIAFDHNPWLVLLAAVMSVAGVTVTLGLFQRAPATTGGQRLGWLFLAAVAAGCSIWATHFIAMLGYRPPAPFSFDPVLTILSLLIAISGTFVGFGVASLFRRQTALAIGGAAVGLAISAMHYTGMFAYRVEGPVEWDQTLVTTSIVLAVLFGAASLEVTARPIRFARYLGIGSMLLAIVSLHFTAMAAFRVTPMAGSVGTDMAAMHALALSIAVVALLILGAGLSSYLIDSRQRSDSYEQLRQMALNDALTGLPNRTSFNNYLAQEIAAAAQEGFRVAVIALDLNRFKEVNDNWGHSAGDGLLCGLAQRMRALLGPGEYVARLGGDEFAAVKRFERRSELLAFVNRLARAGGKPVRLGHLEMAIAASIGVAVYPNDTSDPDALLNNADLAMYRAKTNATDGICFYDPRIGKEVRAQRTLAEDLRRAIAEGVLEVYYQVQAAVETGRITGYEALLRWNHPERGYIPPTEFIALAEENGLIMPLGEWVLRKACADASKWTPGYRVAVNLSAAQLVDTSLPRLVQDVLKETGLSPDRLELELTETAFAKDKMRSMLLLRQIKALGVSVALDDFGTGYSSLDTLRTFPFDKIKLDRAFVHGIEHDPQSKAIIRAVLALGKSLHIPVLAEGIESSNQMSVLHNEGCDEAQGYLLGRPVPVDQLAASGGPVMVQHVDVRAMAKVARGAVPLAIIKPALPAA